MRINNNSTMEILVILIVVSSKVNIGWRREDKQENMESYGKKINSERISKINERKNDVLNFKLPLFRRENLV